MSANYEIHVFRDRNGRWGARAQGSRFGYYTLQHNHREEAATTAICMVTYGESETVQLPMLSKGEAASIGGLYRVRENIEESSQ